MQFIAEAIVKNERRAQMQVDRMQVSSDGFMMNLVAVCLKLCEPFLGVNVKAEKLKVIETDYPLRSSRFHIAKETRLKAQSDEIDKWQKENITEETKKSMQMRTFLFYFRRRQLNDLLPVFFFFFKKNK
jgi:hypothetical protein